MRGIPTASACHSIDVNHAAPDHNRVPVTVGAVRRRWRRRGQQPQAQDKPDNENLEPVSQHLLVALPSCSRRRTMLAVLRRTLTQIKRAKIVRATGDQLIVRWRWLATPRYGGSRDDALLSRARTRDLTNRCPPPLIVGWSIETMRAVRLIIAAMLATSLAFVPVATGMSAMHAPAEMSMSTSASGESAPAATRQTNAQLISVW